MDRSSEPASGAAQPGEPGLRVRKMRATQRALELLTLQLTAEHGLEQVTVEGIAAAAGVSTRTFFNYFASKEDAAFGDAKDDRSGLCLDKSEQAIDLLRDQPAQLPPLRALRGALCAAAEEIAADQELWRLRLRLVQQQPVLLARLVGTFADTEQALVSVIAERTGTDPWRDAYPSVVAFAAIGALRSSVFRWLTTDPPTPLIELIEEAFDALEGGLVPPEQGPAVTPD